MSRIRHRRRSPGSRAVVFGAAGIVVLALAPTSWAQRERTGLWRGPFETPVIGVHSAVLRTGNIMQHSYPTYEPADEASEAYLLDTRTRIGTETPIDVNIFCGGNTFLPDGRLLVVGGKRPCAENLECGGSETRIFDPMTSIWSAGPSLNVGRWYPTAICLPDGRTLVASGNDPHGRRVSALEVLENGSWRVLAGAERLMFAYPWLYVMRDGRIFCAGLREDTRFLDLTTATWSSPLRSLYGNRVEGSSVLLPGLDRVLNVGGRTNAVATNSAEIIDLASPSPAWRYTSPMNFARADFCATLLPDRTVFVSGGNLGDENSPVYEPELFDPEAETWTVLARPTVARGHHSTAVLLRGGGVLVAGSDGEFRAEVFLPPYLFRGPRPRILSAPESLAYGERFSVHSPDAASVGSVVLMRPSATTHWFNPEQRLVDCEFSSLASDQLEVVAPVSANEAPPGYYMLFLVSRDGVPSGGEFVQLGG